MCGEKWVGNTPEKLYLGSPPRVRGKVRIKDDLILIRGITPACAGKSQQLRAELLPVEDHPRVCGEKGADMA